ncbi:MAG: SAM-dependent methyltransferase [Gammaproteobacteria bacterium]|nr:SAM-dependent methyltransferase [Gammaproteobacteria bacterium]
MQANAPFKLPQPEAPALAHSERVAAFLREQIRAGGGSISFAEYMQAALYAPGLGYYSSGTRKFGEQGDFITAPELSPLFSRVLAVQVSSVISQTGSGSILELGAGSGVLAVDVMRRLAELDSLPERYCMLEVSPDLAERQRSYIAAELPGEFSRFEWLDQLPVAFDGVVVANEVADALPVERFTKSDAGIEQLRVAVADDGFAWLRAPAPPLLAEAVEQLERYLGQAFEPGFTSEISLALPAWIDDVCSCLARGFVFLFDYGVSRRELYAVDRTSGWLRCHYRHRVHDDPLILPGIQDLTTWVDFTAIAQAASDAGMSVAGYVTQAHFLAGGGIDAELQALADAPDSDRMDLLRQVKLLTLPDEMGENFKCMGLARGELAIPSGFAFGDRAHVL